MGEGEDRMRTVYPVQYFRAGVLYVRVQWFWHYFRNSICFMCFWFGLEILRLVYKKVFFENWTVSILFDLLSFEKSTTAPYKSWKKNYFKIGRAGYLNRSGILRWFKKCAEVSSLANGKKFFTEKLNFQGLGKFCTPSRLGSPTGEAGEEGRTEASGRGGGQMGVAEAATSLEATQPWEESRIRKMSIFVMHSTYMVLHSSYRI